MVEMGDGRGEEGRGREPSDLERNVMPDHPTHAAL